MEGSEKSCPRCLVVKSFLDFGFTRSGHVRSWCKGCTAETLRKYKKSPEGRAKAAEWQRNWLKSPEHRAQRSEYYKEWNKRPAAKIASRKQTVKRKFGLLWEEYQKLLTDQDQKCAICFQGFSDSRVACVDHDHASGRVRAVLCHPCNAAIGLFGESRSTLSSAIVYLAKHAGFAVIREAQ